MCPFSGSVYSQSEHQLPATQGLVLCPSGVVMKGPEDDPDDPDELGSPQGSIGQPPGPAGSPAPAAQPHQQQGEGEVERSASPEALAEDERNARGAVGLQDDAQVPSQM